MAREISMYIIEHDNQVKKGVRLVMRVLRSKDGGLAKPDHHAEKIITRNAQEWDTAVAMLADNATANERIYASVDERDFDKAIVEFKHRQLDADSYNEDSKQSFYIDIKNRFISCLMSPACRKTKYFLIDCDSDEEYNDAFGNETVAQNALYQYPTKNGRHIVTRPFNPALFQTGEVKKNGLILVGY